MLEDSNSPDKGRDDSLDGLLRTVAEPDAHVTPLSSHPGRAVQRRRKLELSPTTDHRETLR